MSNRLSIIVIVMAVGLATARPAHADQHFRAILTGPQQVPANNFVVSKGIGTVVLNAAETQITVTVSFQDLLTSPILAHIHGTAAVGANAGVLFDFSGAIPAATSGTMPPQVFAISPTQVAELKANLYYFNIHTTPFPGGEIRGQILPAPPARFSTKLSGAEEVPPVASGGKGIGVALLTADETKIAVDLQFSGLSSNATMAHIHGPAAPGVTAPILFTFTGVPAATSGTIPTQVFTVSAAQVAQLKAGQFYFNVHTGTNPDGEVRGQIALAPVQLFTATLNGNQQVPTVSSPGFGTGSVLLNRAETLITVNLSFSGLTSAANAAHIHGPGTIGTNAGVLFDFSADVVGLTSGSIPERTFAITPAQVADLKAGLYYFNIHTGNFGGGEIRGQVLLAPAQLYSGIMAGSQEVPPVVTLGNGVATVVLNPTEDQIDATATFTHLGSNVGAAHIHGPAPNGANAPVIFGFDAVPAATAGSVADQSFAITPVQVVELKTMQHYINVHTGNFPDGEIRAQLGTTPRLTVNRGGTGSAATDTTSYPTGIRCGGDCAESFPVFTAVTLFPGTAASGSAFVGWFGGGCTGTSSCTFTTVNIPTTVTAVYSLSSSPITFTDNPVTSAVTIKAVHITELRGFVNTLRVAHALTPFSFTDPALAAGDTIKAVHVSELRTALSQVYSIRGWLAPSFIEPSLVAGTTEIKAFHINELRMAIKLIE
jgi:hypothetical protein